jgi:hypothetical protein
MSESVKPRFAVDLNEIERQIAQAQGAPSQSAPGTRNDPLAELARIVGQDDPFQSLLASDRPARPRNQANASLDDLFAVRDQVTPASRVTQFQPRHGTQQAAPAFDLNDYPQPQARAAEPSYAYPAQAASQGQEAYEPSAYDQNYYDEDAAPQAESVYDPVDDMGYPPPEKPRARKGLIAVGAIVGAVVIGGGGAYLLNGGSASVSGGQPPLIQASNEPIKVQPQNPGGVEIPNQNKQIYERANNTTTKVVNREEQPVDVKQAVRMNSGASGEATGATAPAHPAQGHPSANALNLGEPRKVRTVSIRPDGTVVQPDGANARSASPLPTMSLPTAAQQPAPSAPRAASAAPAPQPVASTPVAAPATPAPKPAQTASAPAPAAATPAPASSTPASGASPQRVASAQPVTVAPAPASEVTATGGFSVQLGVSGSEEDAQAAFGRFQKKFSELEGMPSMIRKAEVNGNTLFRVRVGPMSRDEASSLCSKLQGQGGQCFVAKN